MKLFRILLSVALILSPIQAWAASGATSISVLDSGSTARTVNVFSSTGAVTGLLSWMNTICDWTTVTTCATVDSNHNLNIGQATAANLNATVVGTGTFAVQASQSGTWTVNPNTAANWGVGATGSAVPANAVYLGITSGGNLTGWTGAVTNAGTFAVQDSTTETNTGTIAGAVSSSVMQENVKQVNGVTVLTGTGATGTGAQRVTISEDTNTIAGSAVGTAGSASSNVVTVQGVSSMTPVQVSQATASNLNAQVTGTGSAGSAASGVVTVQGISSMTPVLVTPSAPADPCFASSKSKVAISQTSATKLVALSSGKKVYVCSIFVLGADAENVSLVEGTQSTNPCDTSTAALIGGSTAANGPNMVAGGGFTLGGGVGTVTESGTASLDVCLFQSGSGRVAGVMTYVQQ